MDLKDKMLDYITSNANWFMTAANIEVIPYYELSPATFNRARQYFAGSADIADVVCLISTSILEPGKSGVLFTTEYVYSKAWGGIFTGSYKNSLDSSSPKFDIINDFDEDRMREIMSDLAQLSADDISEGIEKTLKSLEKSLEKMEHVFSNIIMPVVDVGSEIGAMISNHMVTVNTEKLKKELSNLGEDSSATGELKIYGDLLDASSDLLDVLESVEGRSEADAETVVQAIFAVNNILIDLYNQAEKYIDVDPDDVETYTEFTDWLTFWAFLLSDEDRFEEAYPSLSGLPDLWCGIIEMTDAFLKEDDWDPKFSEIIQDFSDTVIDNIEASLELLVEAIGSEDDALEDKLEEIVRTNQEAFFCFEDALDRATEYLSNLLDDEEDDEKKK